jgi:hypothetical protein
VIACGDLVRYHAREGKGPRGGRAAWLTAECVACGRKSTEVKVGRPGSMAQQERDTTRAELRQHTCPSPRIETDADALLHALARFIRCKEKPDLRFIVRHRLGGARTLDVAVREAWSAAKSGYAMGELLLGCGWQFSATRHEDGRVHVRIAVNGVGLTFHGQDAAVALVLRKNLPAARLNPAIWAPVTDAIQRGAA